MAEMLIKGLLWPFIIAWFVFAYITPAVYVFRKGKVFRGVLYSWGAQIIFAFVTSIILPDLLAYFLPDYTELIYTAYPEGRAVAATLIMGWFPGIIFCWIAKMAYSRNRNHQR